MKVISQVFKLIGQYIGPELDSQCDGFISFYDKRFMAEDSSSNLHFFSDTVKYKGIGT